MERNELYLDNKTLNQLIDKYDKKQLIDLVGYIVNRSKTGQQALLDYCQKNSTPDNHILIVEEQIRQHWNKAASIIQEFDMYGGGSRSDEDDAYYELEIVGELLENNVASWKIRRSVLDEMLEFVASDNSGFTDYLVDIAVILCTTKEENMYLAEYLERYGSSYYKKMAARIFLSNGEDEKFLESKKANLNYGSDYLELAQYYERHGDKEQAVKIVQAGLEKANGRLDEIYAYLFQYYRKNNDGLSLEKLYDGAEKRKWNQDKITELMHGYYKEKNNYEKQKETLLSLLKCVSESKLIELYQDCKKELTEEDFSSNEIDILKIIKKRNLTTYFDIILDKGESREVLKYVLQHQQYGGWGIDSGHYFSKRLVKEYPGEIVEMYWKEIMFYVSLGKEKNYYKAVSILKKVREIMKNNKWTDEWDNRYRIFLEENRRKKLLMKQLEKF